MAAVHSKVWQLSETDRQWLEARLVDFDQLWTPQLLASEAAKLPAEGVVRRCALVEMVKIDLEKQWHAGQRVPLDAYLKTFPELGTPATVAVDLILAEYQVRKQFGATVELAWFAKRFERATDELEAALAESVNAASKATLAPQGSTKEVRRPSPSPASAPSGGAGKSGSEAKSPKSQAATKPRAGAAQRAAMPDRIGRFQIRARLGAGAFGTVYRAYDPQLEREVALKVPNPGTLGDPNLVERFLREARAAAKLRHPHIVPIHDAGHDGTHYYIASAFIEGRPLARAINDEPFTFEQCARIVRQLAEALAYAHEQGIVHRDVKPSNVMLDAKGEAHLMDFGLAHRHEAGSQLTQEGDVIGTPAYMAPEQAEGKQGKALPASDQYSLGVVLYELLCGRRPFEGPPAAVIHQAIHADPQAPRGINTSVSRDLETICLKAMAKRVEERYTSCLELADDLRRWAEGEPIRARRLGPAERLIRWCKREPALAVACALAVTGLLAATLVFAMSSVQMKALAEREKDETERARAAEATALQAREAEARAKEGEKRRREQAEAAEQEQARQRKLAETAQKRAEEEQKKAEEQRQRADTSANELKRALAKVEASFYLNAVALADREFSAGSLYRADELLRTCPPALRSWEWHYLKRQVHPNLMTLRGHTNQVSCLAYSPDGKRIASGAWCEKNPGEFKLWDAADGRELLELKGHSDLVSSVAFSPDGKVLASGSRDTTVRVWDGPTGRHLRTLSSEGLVMSLAFSPDGQRLATGGTVDRNINSAGQVRIWEVSTGKELRTLKGHAGPVWCLAFSPDGTSLATGSGFEIKAIGLGGLGFKPAEKPTEVRIYEVNTGRESRALRNLTGEVRALAYSQDGKQLATASGDGIKVWIPATGREVRTFRASRGAFSLDGQRFASVGENTIRLLDVANGRELLTITGFMSSPIAFSANGKRLVTAGGDSTLKIFDTSVGRGGRTFNVDVQGPHQFAFDAAGERFFTTRGEVLEPGGEVRGWETTTGDEVLRIKGLPSHVTSIAVSPDGKLVVSACVAPDDASAMQMHGEIFIADSKTGKLAHRLRGHKSFVSSVVFSHNGKLLASASNGLELKDGKPIEVGGDVILWDVTNGKQLHLLGGHTKGVTSLAFSRDGSQLASASADRTVKVWQVANGKETGSLGPHGGHVVDIAFSPDGQRMATASRSAEISGLMELVGRNLKDLDAKQLDPDLEKKGPEGITVWDVATAKRVFNIDSRHAEFASVRYSPDGARLFGAIDKEIKMWDSGSGVEVFTLRGHTGPIVGLALSRDGKILTSASGRYLTDVAPKGTADATGEVRIWDARSSEEQAIQGPAGAHAGPQALAEEPEPKNQAKTEPTARPEAPDAKQKAQAIAAIKRTGGRVVGLDVDSDLLIDFTGTKVTDDGMNLLKGLKVDSLSLAGTKITDRGLEVLKGMSSLSTLNLSGTKITDAGLENLKEAEVIRLWLDGTNITDVGVKHLCNVRPWNTLSLADTKVSDDCLSHIKRMGSLEILSLARTKVTDTGLEQMKGLKSLQELDLSGTKITDAGLEKLKGMDRLSTLGLNGTRVTDKGVLGLRAALPRAITIVR